MISRTLLLLQDLLQPLARVQDLFFTKMLLLPVLWVFSFGV